MDLYPLRTAALNLISAIDSAETVPSDQSERNLARAAAHLHDQLDAVISAKLAEELEAGTQIGPFIVTPNGIGIDLGFFKRGDEDATPGEDGDSAAESPQDKNRAGEPIGLSDRLGRALYVGDTVQVTGSDRFGDVLGEVTGASDTGRVEMTLNLSTASRLSEEPHEGLAEEALTYTSSTGRVERMRSAFDADVRDDASRTRAFA